MKSSIVIVDDHAAVRQLLSRALQLQGEYNVVGETGSGIEALQLCEKEKPDIVLIDLLLPELSGVQVIRRVRHDMAGIRVVVFSGVVDERLIEESLKCRPHAFVWKLEPLQMLIDALQAVRTGGRFFSSAVDRLLDLPHSADLNSLSRRETEVLQLIAESNTTKEIAQILGISIKTVDNHRTRLMEKLCLHDVAALTRYAIRLGLVTITK